jgi:hypothetical protein
VKKKKKNVLNLLFFLGELKKKKKKKKKEKGEGRGLPNGQKADFPFEKTQLKSNLSACHSVFSTEFFSLYFLLM